MVNGVPAGDHNTAREEEIVQHFTRPKQEDGLGSPGKTAGKKYRSIHRAHATCLEHKNQETAKNMPPSMGLWCMVYGVAPTFFARSDERGSTEMQLLLALGPCNTAGCPC